MSGKQQAEQAPVAVLGERWQSHLRETSAVYRSLMDERRRGWESAALDAFYGFRGETTTSSSAHNTNSAGSAVSSAPARSAFADADIPALCERYRQHAARILLGAAPHFFSEHSARTRGGAPRTFLDLGCAPGGVSKFLLWQGWRGAGVTLAPDASAGSGIPVDPALLRLGGDDDGSSERVGCGDSSSGARSCWRGARYVLLTGDVTQPRDHWTAFPIVNAAPQGSAASTSQDTSDWAPVDNTAAVVGAVRTGRTRFDFVNAGAVQDYGQRLLSEMEHKERARDSSDGSGGGAACGVVLPWFTLLEPQLRHAFSFLFGDDDTGADEEDNAKNDSECGDSGLMFVYGAPHCASFFILLALLADIFYGCPETDERSSECGQGKTRDAAIDAGAAAPVGERQRLRGRVHVLETMHLTKPPVYVLFTGLSARTGAADRRRRLARLLDSMRGDNSVVAPSLLRGDNAVPSEAHDSNTSALEAKRRFWLGESEGGAAAAARGLALFGAQLEAVWARTEDFLRLRRLKAERLYGGGGANMRGGRPVSSSALFAKRPLKK